MLSVVNVQASTCDRLPRSVTTSINALERYDTTKLPLAFLRACVRTTTASFASICLARAAKLQANGPRSCVVGSLIICVRRPTACEHEAAAAFFSIRSTITSKTRTKVLRSVKLVVLRIIEKSLDPTFSASLESIRAATASRPCDKTYRASRSLVSPIT